MTLHCPHGDYMFCSACPPVTAEHIRQSNLIEGIEDDREHTQSMYAWDWLVSQGNELTHDVVRRLQHLIVVNQTDLPDKAKGQYRTVGVRVGRYVAPHYGMVYGMMDDWLRTDGDPWAKHVDFETIHPFQDGNGRTGRMLMWWHEIKAGSAPTLIWARNRFRYYDDLEAGRAGG